MRKGQKVVKGVAKLELMIRLRRPIKGKDRKGMYGRTRAFSIVFPGRDATEEDADRLLEELRESLALYPPRGAGGKGIDGVGAEAVRG